MAYVVFLNHLLIWFDVAPGMETLDCKHQLCPKVALIYVRNIVYEMPAVRILMSLIIQNEFQYFVFSIVAIAATVTLYTYIKRIESNVFSQTHSFT